MQAYIDYAPHDKIHRQFKRYTLVHRVNIAYKTVKAVIRAFTTGTAATAGLPKRGRHHEH